MCFEEDYEVSLRLFYRGNSWSERGSTAGTWQAEKIEQPYPPILEAMLSEGVDGKCMKSGDGLNRRFHRP